MPNMESKLAAAARAELAALTRRLSAEQRLHAFLQHSQLMAALYNSGQKLRHVAKRTGS